MMAKQTLEILYEDKWLAVVNKPSGMLSVPYPGSSGKTALDELTEQRRKTGRVSAKSRPQAVHRLDRDTSGVLLFALSEEAKGRLMDNWQTLVSERRYVALAEHPASAKKAAVPETGIISASLAFNAYHQAFVPAERDYVKNKRLETVSAVTHYKILLRGEKYALFELSLETGRKNQIRAHLAFLGFPIAGDENYRARTNPVHRLALHARTLAFSHPFTGEALRFEVSEPENWAKIAAGENHAAKTAPAELSAKPSRNRKIKNTP